MSELNRNMWAVITEKEILATHCFYLEAKVVAESYASETGKTDAYIITDSAAMRTFRQC